MLCLVFVFFLIGYSYVTTPTYYIAIDPGQPQKVDEVQNKAINFQAIRIILN